MLVMILERTRPSLKGVLSRWLIEPKSGVFLGNPSARIRDELWAMAVAKAVGGSVTQIWSAQCPQGYRYRTSGTASRQFVHFEGLDLILRPQKSPTHHRGNASPTDAERPKKKEEGPRS